jgi:undecaprenyl-diphosphatase
MTGPSLVFTTCGTGSDLDFIQVIVLAIVQGITEFLPISSSGHLVLVPRFMGWPDQGLAFDVAVHVGTLSAVLFYFRDDLRVMIRAWLRSLGGAGVDPDARLAWAVLIGTIPVGLVGFLFSDEIETYLRSPMLIAATTAGFGIVLGAADRFGSRTRDEHSLQLKDVLLIGAAQALALVPGTSRSGITMTAGLALGLNRAAAARFSFLLSIPVIVLAGGLETLHLVSSPQPVVWRDLFLAVVLSAASAYLCITLFLKFLESRGMLPFVLYRLVLAAVIVYAFA